MGRRPLGLVLFLSCLYKWFKIWEGAFSADDQELAQPGSLPGVPGICVDQRAPVNCEAAGPLSPASQPAHSMVLHNKTEESLNSRQPGDFPHHHLPLKFNQVLEQIQ